MCSSRGTTVGYRNLNRSYVVIIFNLGHSVFTRDNLRIAKLKEENKYSSWTKLFLSTQERNVKETCKDQPVTFNENVKACLRAVQIAPES